ncbi:hypothetical protein AAE478_005772 [Parahypoxylon ruwenzoriense]
MAHNQQQYTTPAKRHPRSSRQAIERERLLAQAAIRALQMKHKELERLNEVLSSQISQARGAHVDPKPTVFYQSRILELDRENRRLAGQVAQLEDDVLVQELSSENQKRVQKLEAQNLALDNLISSLRKELSDKTWQASQDRAKDKRRQKELEDIVYQLRTDLDQEMDRSHQQSSEYEDKLKELEDTITSLRTRPINSRFSNDEINLLKKQKQELLGLLSQTTFEGKNVLDVNTFRLEYQALFTAVENWVFQWFEGTFTKREALTRHLSNAPGSRSAIRLVDWMIRYPDLVWLAKFEWTDEDVLIALIMRWLNENIFTRPLSGVFRDEVRMLLVMEESLRINVQLSQYVLGLWRRNAFDAIVHLPNYESRRTDREGQLTRRLWGHFEYLRQAGRSSPKAMEQLHETIIKPAVKLQEGITTSADNFNIVFPEFFAGGFTSIGSGSMYDEIDAFELRDLSQSQRVIGKNEMWAQDLKAIAPVCALSPLTTHSRVSRDGTGAVQICTPAITFVASRPAEETRRHRQIAPTFMSELYDKMGPALVNLLSTAGGPVFRDSDDDATTGAE